MQQQTAAAPAPVGPPQPADVERFYRAALVGLTALDALRGKRRFGPEADARWGAFRGELQDSDRLDLLLRDAACTHPAAFAPRILFSLPGLPADEPFGPDWPGAGEPLAAALLREARQSEAPSLAALLARAAQSWGLHPQALPGEPLKDIRPASRLVMAGAGAVTALATHADGRRDLDLADQTLLIAADPSTRQLFGLALVWLGSSSKLRVLSPAHAAAAAARAAGQPHLTAALVSPDAPPEARDAAQRLLQELGG